jgi:hypothetical protein
MKYLMMALLCFVFMTVSACGDDDDRVAADVATEQRDSDLLELDAQGTDDTTADVVEGDDDAAETTPEVPDEDSSEAEDDEDDAAQADDSTEAPEEEDVPEDSNP